ncbi:MAG: large conductance mechanosensitive channel protein MscL [Oscillospiraceae bacterium]|nr:large conductance mechanosensitive channel protein MscL [Oscillospiraceae bacterium]
MRKFLQEFKEFALKGNVMNLAVGVIIGAAFQGVVTSLTNNILSPIIGLFVGQNFDSISFTILGVEIMFGAFITSILNFIIMAFVIFLLVKMMNLILTYGKKDSAPDAPTTRECPFCLSEIKIKATRCPLCTSELPVHED